MSAFPCSPCETRQTRSGHTFRHTQSRPGTPQACTVRHPCWALTRHSFKACWFQTRLAFRHAQSRPGSPFRACQVQTHARLSACSGPVPAHPSVCWIRTPPGCFTRLPVRPACSRPGTPLQSTSSRSGLPLPQQARQIQIRLSIEDRQFQTRHALCS